MAKEPMKRKAGQTVDEMTKQLLESKAKNHLYKPSYSESSAAVKTEALTAAIDQQMKLLEDSCGEQINLDSLEEVKSLTKKYMESCKAAAAFPTLMGWAAAAGYGRTAVYQHFARHPDSPTAKYFNQIRSAWAAILSNAGLHRNCSEAVSIFLLKNSGQDLTDKQDISIEAKTADPLGTPTSQQILMERYLESYEESDL